jgi:hypothetical protein
MVEKAWPWTLSLHMHMHLPLFFICTHERRPSWHVTDHLHSGTITCYSKHAQTAYPSVPYATHLLISALHSSFTHAEHNAVVLGVRLDSGNCSVTHALLSA